TGPAVAAILLQYLGPAECFLVNGLSYIAVLLALAAMRPTPWTTSGVRQRASPREALTFLGHRPRLVLLLGLTAAVAGCGWPVLAMLPALAARQLGAGQGAYGILV